MPSISQPLAFLIGVFMQTLMVGTYFHTSSAAHQPRLLYVPTIGVFIPLLFVASYAQWKKVSKGQKLNVVMVLTTIFFGLSIPTVSDLLCGWYHPIAWAFLTSETALDS
jgi:hypothetical protein